MRSFRKIVIGKQAIVHHTITRRDIDNFVALTGDDNPVHTDDAYAAKTPLRKPVAHGMLTAAFISTLIGTKLPGEGALWVSQKLEFIRPVRIGDRISVVGTIAGKHERTGTLDLVTEVFNQDRQKVISGTATVKILEPRSSDGSPGGQSRARSRVKTAVVIGATGGIGQAVALRLATEGYRLGLHYWTNAKGARALVEKINRQGGRAFAVGADLLSDAGLEELIDVVKRRFSLLSVYVNTATTSLPHIRFGDLEWEDMQKQIEVQVKSNFVLLKAFLPLMAAQRYGKIITILTQAIEQPTPEWLHYGTAKAALAGFSKALAIEYAALGIRVNMVSPGMTDTDLLAGMPERVQALVAARAPLKRIATPADVAEAVWFLASPASDYLTGETIRVNGGQVMI